jgi:DNA-binding HxlR family transcriptional regulator
MPKKNRSARRSDCPISYALELFGDKWTLLIIRDLLFKPKRRYREFAESGERIATNILAERLAKLEAWELITKEPDPGNGRQFIYRVTEKALDLAPVLVEMIVWAAKYDPDTAADKEFVRKAKGNRERLIRDVVAAIPV